METLKKCWERAELLLETVRQRPNKMCAISPNSGANLPSRWKSIHQKLAELYIEECSREPKRKHLRNASHLLDKLVARDKLGCLLVNLYPGNEGYSVMMKGRSGMDTETVRLPYEEAELLQYIDNEELPPVLVDILECSQVNVFYSGCVIAEVRDYRRSACPTIYESHHVLLRPSMQTLVCDVNALTSDSAKWNHEDKMALESQLILATQEPLCLEPSVTVALVANRQQHAKHAFAVHPIKQMAKKYSQAAINRKWKFERHPAPPDLRLCDFLTSHKDRSKKGVTAVTAASLRLGKMGVNLWKQREVKLTAPEEVNAMLYAMSIPPPHSSGNSLDFVEEYILESKQGNGKGYYCRLSIQLRPLDDVYVGELYTDRDYIVGVPRGGSCWFEFRTRADVDKYLHQFIDIFTQESRKVVKISHKVGDEDPVVRTLPGGQSIVFPLTSAASTALQLGELPSPVAKVSSSTSSCVDISATVTGDTVAASNRTTTARPVNSVGPQQRPPTIQSSDSPVLAVVSPTQTRPPPNPTPPPASKVPPTPVPGPVTSAQPVGLIGRLQSSLAGFLNSSLSGEADEPMPGTTALAPVSLATAPLGSIAEPISLTVVASPNQPSLVTTPTGFIVGQIPNLVTHAPSCIGSTISSSTSQSIVCGGLTTTTSNPSSTSMVVTSGMLTSSGPSVLSAPTGVVSIPVGITGSLSSPNLAARLIASGLKNSGVGGPSHHGLLQVTGSHLTTGSIFAVGSPAHKPVAAKIGIPPSHTSQNVPGSTPPTAHSAKFCSTLMKFSGQPHLHFTLQQSQVASLQLQQLRQKQQENGLVTQTPTLTTAVVAPAPKGKSRKRKATTPPK